MVGSLARLAPGAIASGLEHLERQIARFQPDQPFTYQFLDERFDAMYRTEQRLGQIFTTVAILALIVACLGLFGLAAYAAEIRTKEIGIRKVLGASVANIIALLSKDFVLLVLIAFLLAAPLAYVAMSRWLESFAYRITLDPTLFLAAGAGALVVALVTVSYQALRAALADPVKALRRD